MAIDFPNSPIEGSTYDFGGTRYTFTLIGGAPGYWLVSEPGLAGPASTAEIDTGTDAFKYLTPDAMEDSKYMDKFVLQANGAAGLDIGRGENINFNTSLAGSAGGLNVARVGDTIQLGTVAATTGVKGVVQLNSAVDSESEILAATPKAVKQAYDLALVKANLSEAGTSTNKKFTFSDLSGANLQFIAGRDTISGSNKTNQTFNFAESGFDTRCYGVFVNVAELMGSQGTGNTALNCASFTQTTFKVERMTHNNSSVLIDFTYIAIGQ